MGGATGSNLPAWYRALCGSEPTLELGTCLRGAAIPEGCLHGKARSNHAPARPQGHSILQGQCWQPPSTYSGQRNQAVLPCCKAQETLLPDPERMGAGAITLPRTTSSPRTTQQRQRHPLLASSSIPKDATEGQKPDSEEALGKNRHSHISRI